MATVPSNEPALNTEGFSSVSGAITLQKQIQAVRKADPIFAIGDENLKGYVALKMYDQTTASVINSEDLDPTDFDLFRGESYASGQPYVTNEATWASGGDLADL